MAMMISGSDFCFFLFPDTKIKEKADKVFQYAIK